MVDQTHSLKQERKQVAELGREILAQELTKGTMGNVSIKHGGRFAMSPSGVPYENVTKDKVPIISVTGEKLEGELKPSSETPMHSVIYQNRDDVGSIIHTHSPYATTFASLNTSIPASHYLLAFAGRDVPVTGYAPPGTTELGEMAAETMGQDRNAALLKNHGVIAVGATPDEALQVAQMVEYCARIHYQASSIGEPEILSDSEIDNLSDMFQNDYGQN